MASCITERRSPSDVSKTSKPSNISSRALDVLPFSPRAAAHYGQVRAELDRRGTPVGPHDMLIGAHARAEGLILVTNNMREFKRMTGVRAENWV